MTERYRVFLRRGADRVAITASRRIAYKAHRGTAWQILFPGERADLAETDRIAVHATEMGETVIHLRWFQNGQVLWETTKTIAKDRLELPLAIRDALTSAAK